MKKLCIALIGCVSVGMFGPLRAQTSSQTVYFPCNDPITDNYPCPAGCGASFINESLAGGSGTMDLVQPTMCATSSIECETPTATEGFYQAVPDVEFGCSNSLGNCDPTDPLAPLCPAGSTCTDSGGPGICIKNPTGNPFCTQTGLTGCVAGTLTDCCGGATCENGTCVPINTGGTGGGGGGGGSEGGGGGGEGGGGSGCSGDAPCDGASCIDGGWDVAGCSNSDCNGDAPCSSAVCTGGIWNTSGCGSVFTCNGDPPCDQAVCVAQDTWNTDACCDYYSDPCCSN